METLTGTTFFQLVSGSKANGDLKASYRDFTLKVFELCYDTELDYDTLIFTLNHTHIELTSLLDSMASTGAGEKCGNATAS